MFWIDLGCVSQTFQKNAILARGNGHFVLCDSLLFLGLFIWKMCLKIIGLKAPGNYSDQFWYNKISTLSCEGPEPPNSMIS